MRMVTNPVQGSRSLAVRRRATATWVDLRVRARIQLCQCAPTM